MKTLRFIFWVSRHLPSRFDQVFASIATWKSLPITVCCAVKAVRFTVSVEIDRVQGLTRRDKQPIAL